ncbi:MAG: HAD family hydrolase [Promethearchaeia archaeon]
MKNIQAILWDLGGVIVNLEYTPFYNFIKTHSERQLTESRFKQILMSNYEAYHEGKIDSHEFFELMQKILKLKPIEEGVFFKAFNSIIKALNTETIAVIKHLKQYNIKALILSNVNAAHWNHLLTKNWKWMGLFDDFILSYKVGVTKPNPEIYRYAIDKTGCEADQILFIDDNYVNIKGAKQCGIHTIFYKSQSQFRSKMRKILEIELQM